MSSIQWHAVALPCRVETVIAAIIGGFAGGALGPIVTAWLAERSDRRRALNTAIAALQAAQAARHIGTGIDPAYFDSDAEGAANFGAQMRVREIERYTNAQWEARLALAHLSPYLKVEVTKWEITEPEASALIAQLERARGRSARRSRAMTQP